MTDQTAQHEESTPETESETELEHGEVHASLLGLQRVLERRQARYGGLPNESADNQAAGKAFVAKFEKVGVPETVRGELRDNVYGHFVALTTQAIALAETAEDIEDDVTELSDQIQIIKAAVEQMSTAVEGVVVRQLLTQAQLLAGICLQRYKDPDTLLLAKAIMDAYQIPRVAATVEPMVETLDASRSVDASQSADAR